MKILVTGTSGFVGRHLVGHLKSLEHDVIPVVRRKLSQSECDAVEVGEINGETDYEKVLEGVESVVHLAARVHVMNDKSEHALEEYRTVNLSGTVNLAVQSAKAGVKRFVFVSSIKVNGEATPCGYAFKETDEINPLDHYGVSKSEAEKELIKIQNETGMEIVIIRPPLVYGPGVKANFKKIVDLVRTKPIIPLGAINNKRSIVSVYNLVDFIAICLVHDNASGQVFLVSDGLDISTSELVEAIASAHGKKRLILPFPLSLAKIASKITGNDQTIKRLYGSLCIDISKARVLLQWNPPYSFKEGLEKMLEKN